MHKVSKRHSNSIMINYEEHIFSDGELWSNRGNNLVISLLRNRYPLLCTEESVNSVTTLLYTPDAVGHFKDPEIEQKLRDINYQVDEVADSLTEDEKGRMLCFITSKLLTTLNTTHCTPIPTNKFQLPWIHSNGSDFVKLDDVDDVEYDSSSDKESE